MLVRIRMSSKRLMPLKTSRSTTKVHRSPRTDSARWIVQFSIDQLSASGIAGPGAQQPRWPGRSGWLKVTWLGRSA